MKYEVSDTPENPFGQRAISMGEVTASTAPLPDLRIGESDEPKRDVIPEPAVTLIPNVALGMREMDEAQLATGQEHNKPQETGTNVSEHTKKIELTGRQAVRSAAEWFGAPSEESPVQEAGTPLEEIPGQMELPFHELPVPLDPYVQEELDFGASTALSQEQETTAPSEEVAEPQVAGEVLPTPEQVIAEHADATFRALKAAADKHAELVKEHNKEWENFTELLRTDGVIYKVNNYVPQAGVAELTWRIDINEPNPLSQLDQVKGNNVVGDSDLPELKFKYIDVTIEYGDLKRSPVPEARTAIGWLAGGHHPRRELKDTSLLGVPADKGPHGKYGYDVQALSVKLAEEFAGCTRRALVTYYNQPKSHENPDEYENVLMVEAPNSYTSTLPVDLRGIMEGGDHAAHIVERNMERLRGWAQRHSGDVHNPLAFPNPKEVRELMTRWFMFDLNDRVQSLKTVNGDLSRYGVVVSRLFPKPEPAHKK